MLSKSRCPHTGVINFFTLADPLLAVGSVAETGAFPRYVWRCYIGDEASGLEPDIPAAEARLRRAIEGSGCERRAKGVRKTAVAQAANASSHWQRLNETTVLPTRGSRS